MKIEHYSRESFVGYKLRVRISLVTLEDTYQTEVYTTETTRDSVQKYLDSHTSEEVSKVVVDHWSTYEQDRASDRFIKNLLKRKNNENI